MERHGKSDAFALRFRPKAGFRFCVPNLLQPEVPFLVVGEPRGPQRLRRISWSRVHASTHLQPGKIEIRNTRVVRNGVVQADSSTYIGSRRRTTAASTISISSNRNSSSNKIEPHLAHRPERCDVVPEGKHVPHVPAVHHHHQALPADLENAQSSDVTTDTRLVVA